MCYHNFNLVMDRSSGFGSTPSNYSLYSNSLSLRLPYSVKLATERKSLTHYAKGTQSPRRAPTVCMYAVSDSISLPAFPSRYWFTIGRLRVFSLGGWSPHLRAGCHVSRPTSHALSTTKLISYTGLSPSIAELSRSFYCVFCYQALGCCAFARRY